MGNWNYELQREREDTKFLSCYALFRHPEDYTNGNRINIIGIVFDVGLPFGGQVNLHEYRK